MTTIPVEFSNRPLRVLHVDDDEGDYIIVRDLLYEITDLSFEIDWVGDYDLALDALVSNRHDLCLLDYFLDPHNGLDLFRAARARGCTIPSVMLTGTGNRSIDLEAMNSGVSFYVDKNRLDAYDLERAIRYSLEHARILQMVEFSNERLEVIFRTTNDPIVLVNPEGLIEVPNLAFSRLFGLEMETQNPQSLSQIAVEKDRGHLEATIHQVAETGESQRTQLQAYRDDGSIVDIEVNLAQVVDNENHVVCSFHDISHFATIARMKDDFVSMVTHELRTPISSTRLSLEMVLTHFDQLGYQRSREKLEQSLRQIMLLSETVDGILDISSIEATQSQRGITDLVLQDILHQAVTELMPRALDKQQDVRIWQPEDHIRLQGNALDFTRIWRNLISNAVKYTPEHGRINIRLDLVNGRDHLSQTDLEDQDRLAQRLGDGRYVVGQVEDSGHGIPDEDMDTLFMRFSRGWAKTSQIPGTGLGLALVRDLLLIYEGEIMVSSKLNVGSTFTFWIPYDQVAVPLP